jgi:hypothetical protein
MKSGLSHSLLALAASTLGIGGTHPEGSKAKPMRLRPPAACPPFQLLRPRPTGASQSPPYNQRKARQARRAFR